MLIAKNIHKKLGTHEILRGVDAIVTPGAITVLIGPSGSGKTTLLRAMSLIDPADSGTITVDGEVHSFPREPLKEGEALPQDPWPRLTVVFQQHFLWPHLSLRDNILLPARNIANPHLDREFEELVEVLGMKDFINRYPNEASLGQRQRTALARAILLKPRYILMDEITSALDIEQISAINAFLPRLKERGIGIFIITHLINFARRAADYILFMDGGQILENGSADILDNPHNERLKAFLSTVDAAS